MGPFCVIVVQGTENNPLKKDVYVEQKEQSRHFRRSRFRNSLHLFISPSAPSETFAEMTPAPKSRSVQQVAVGLLCVLVGILSGLRGTMGKPAVTLIHWTLEDFHHWHSSGDGGGGVAFRRRWSPSRRLPNSHINVLSRPHSQIIRTLEIRSLSLHKRLFSVVVPQAAWQPDDKRAARGTAEWGGRVGRGVVKAEASTPLGHRSDIEPDPLLGDDAAFVPQPRVTVSNMASNTARITASSTASNTAIFHSSITRCCWSKSCATCRPTSRSISRRQQVFGLGQSSSSSSSPPAKSWTRILIPRCLFPHRK